MRTADFALRRGLSEAATMLAGRQGLGLSGCTQSSGRITCYICSVKGVSQRQPLVSAAMHHCGQHSRGSCVVYYTSLFTKKPS